MYKKRRNYRRGIYKVSCTSIWIEEFWKARRCSWRQSGRFRSTNRITLTAKSSFCFIQRSMRSHQANGPICYAKRTWPGAKTLQVLLYNHREHQSSWQAHPVILTYHTLGVLCQQPKLKRTMYSPFTESASPTSTCRHSTNCIPWTHTIVRPSRHNSRQESNQLRRIGIACSSKIP